jgi:hypothetical protein
MAIRIGCYLQFVDQDTLAMVGPSWQNIFIGQTRFYDSTFFLFAPFNITDTAGSSGGDRAESRIVANLNPVADNVFASARLNRWLIRARFIRIDTINNVEVNEYSNQLWRIGPISRRNEIEVTLSSPLDAVRADAPSLKLSAKMTGSIPQSGALILT